MHEYGLLLPVLCYCLNPEHFLNRKVSQAVSIDETFRICFEIGNVINILCFIHIIFLSDVLRKKSSYQIKYTDLGTSFYL